MVGFILLVVPQVERPTLPEHAVARLLPLNYRHEATVLEAVLPSDRSRLYTVDATGFLNAWDVATGRRLYRLEPTKGFGSARGLVASPDGKVLALAPPEREPPLVQLFNADSGKVFRRIERARAPTFSADATVMAAIDGKTIRRVLVASGRELPLLMDEDVSEFISVAVSPDASRIAAGFLGGLTLWDGVTGKLLDRSSPDENRPSSCMAFSADGTMLATGGLWGVHLFKVETRLSIVTSFDALAGRSVGFSKDGRHLLALHRGRHVQTWDVKRGERLCEWRAHGDLDAERLSFSTDGEVLMRLRGDGLQLLDASVTERYEGVTATAFLPDGRALTGDGKGRVRVWNTEVGCDEEATTTPGLAVREFSGDCRRVFLMDAASVVVWDRTARKEVFRRKEEELELATMSADGTRLAVYADRRLSIWDVAGNAKRAGWKTPNGYVSAVSFSPDGRVLAQGTAGGGLTLTDADTGREVLTFAPRSASDIRAIAFSRDGARVATGDAAGVVRVWDEGKEPSILLRRVGEIRALAFSPDARHLAGGSRIGGGIVCSLREPYEVVAELAWGESGLASTAFSSDSRRLLSGGLDGAVYVWAIPESK